MHTTVNTCYISNTYQQVQERCSSAAQVEHIPNHSDGALGQTGMRGSGVHAHLLQL